MELSHRARAPLDVSRHDGDNDVISTSMKAEHSGIEPGRGFWWKPSPSLGHGNQLHTDRRTVKKPHFHGDDDAVESFEAQIINLTGHFMEDLGKP